jgi:hypothetical protein
MKKRLFVSMLLGVSLLSAFAQVKDLAYFQGKISTAYQSGADSVVLDTGTFYLDYAGGGEFFELKGLQHFTISAYGTKFIFTSGERAFTISDSEHLNIRGLTIDYWPLPFTQGTIAAVNGALATVDIHAGYPGRGEGMDDQFDKANLIAPHSRSLKADVYPARNLAETWLNERQVQITLTANRNIQEVSVGDRIVFFYRNYGGAGHTIFLERCASLTFRDLTIHSTIGRAFLESHGPGNSTYQNVRVTYGAPPPGASEPRLFTSVAAGIRTIGLTQGPQILDSRFEGLGDDGCNIQGDYFLIFGVGSNYVHIAPKRAQYFEPGDTLVCVDRSGVEVGLAVLESVVETPKPPNFDSTRAAYVAGTTYETRAGTFNQYYRFSFTGQLHPAAGFYLYNLNKVGAGCRIENTIYRNIRARGIIVKAPHARIVNNRIENITAAGIMVVPEIVYWLESGPTKDCLISGNLIKNTNFRPSSWDDTQGAAIVVSCEGEDANENTMFTPGIIHRQVEIRDNVIEDTPGPGMVISSTQQVKVSGNQFRNTNYQAGWQGGTNVGVDVGAALYITASDSVFLCDNRVVAQGAGGTSHQTITSTVTHFFDDCEGDITHQRHLPTEQPQLRVFPNPATALVYIRVKLDERGPYSLDLYEANGRKIDALFAGLLPQGETTFVWNPNPTFAKQTFICVLTNQQTSHVVTQRFYFE